MKLFQALIPAAAAVMLGIVQIPAAKAQTQQQIGLGQQQQQTNTNTTSTSQAANANQQGNQNITFNAPAAVEYRGGYDFRNVPAVGAPGLTTTLTETCMGSTSVGGAGVGFGFSAGTTWKDTDCVNRLNARELRTFGDTAAAKEVMCENDVVRAAYKRIGQPCAPREEDKPKAVVVAPVKDGSSNVVKTRQ